MEFCAPPPQVTLAGQLTAAFRVDEGGVGLSFLPFLVNVAFFFADDDDGLCFLALVVLPTFVRVQVITVATAAAAVEVIRKVFVGEMWLLQ